MSTATVGAHDHGATSSASFISTYVFSRDHKIIGLQFLFSTLLWFLVGGLLALGIRWQLAYPWSEMPFIGRLLFPNEGGQISPEFYTTAVYDARDGDDLLCDHSNSCRGIRKLFDPTDDRCRRHGVPHAEYAQLLVHVASVHLHGNDIYIGPVEVPDQGGHPIRRYRSFKSRRLQAVQLKPIG